MRVLNFKDNLQFDIQSVEAESLVYLHRELTFKLVYIIEGTGIHRVHRNSFHYNRGDTFIDSPGEENHFLATTNATRFLVVKFTSLFITGDMLNNDSKSNLLQLLQYANQHPDYIIRLRNELQLITQLVDTLITEINNETNRQEYMRQLVYTIIIIIGETIKAMLPEKVNQNVDQKTIDMLHYIHINIFEPEKLTTIELSRKFFISPAYVGRYFKSKTNQNLHQYILLYKITLIESRLKNSNMRICEIADEFGFSDTSYLNKVFMKFYGVSPLSYRNNNKNNHVGMA